MKKVCLFSLLILCIFLTGCHLTNNNAAGEEKTSQSKQDVFSINEQIAPEKAQTGEANANWKDENVLSPSDSSQNGDGVVLPEQQAFSLQEQWSGLPEDGDLALLYETTVSKIENPVEYSLFDINGDGIKEMIVRTGTCEADYQFSFYAIKNNEVKGLGSFRGGHSMLVDDNSRLVIFGGLQGDEWAYLVKYDGKEMMIETMFDRDIGENDYTQWEHYIETYEIS